MQPGAFWGSKLRTIPQKTTGINKSITFMDMPRFENPTIEGEREQELSRNLPLEIGEILYSSSLNFPSAPPGFSSVLVGYSGYTYNVFTKVGIDEALIMVDPVTLETVTTIPKDLLFPGCWADVGRKLMISLSNGRSFEISPCDAIPPSQGANRIRAMEGVDGIREWLIKALEQQEEDVPESAPTPYPSNTTPLMDGGFHFFNTEHFVPVREQTGQQEIRVKGADTNSISILNINAIREPLGYHSGPNPAQTLKDVSVSMGYNEKHDEEGDTIVECHIPFRPKQRCQQPQKTLLSSGSLPVMSQRQDAVIPASDTQIFPQPQTSPNYTQTPASPPVPTMVTTGTQTEQPLLSVDASTNTQPTNKPVLLHSTTQTEPDPEASKYSRPKDPTPAHSKPLSVLLNAGGTLYLLELNSEQVNQATTDGPILVSLTLPEQNSNTHSCGQVDTPTAKPIVCNPSPAADPALFEPSRRILLTDDIPYVPSETSRPRSPRSLSLVPERVLSSTQLEKEDEKEDKWAPISVRTLARKGDKDTNETENSSHGKGEVCREDERSTKREIERERTTSSTTKEKEESVTEESQGGPTKRHSEHKRTDHKVRNIMLNSTDASVSSIRSDVGSAAPIAPSPPVHPPRLVQALSSPTSPIMLAILPLQQGAFALELSVTKTTSTTQSPTTILMPPPAQLQPKRLRLRCDPSSFMVVLGLGPENHKSLLLLESASTGSNATAVTPSTILECNSWLTERDLESTIVFSFRRAGESRGANEVRAFKMTLPMSVRKWVDALTQTVSLIDQEGYRSKHE